MIEKIVESPRRLGKTAEACAITIVQAVCGEVVWVSMGKATQSQIDAMRDRLHAAALAQVEPIEIITRTVGQETGFIVRRFRE